MLTRLFQCFKAMYNDYVELRSLREVADILAQTDHWPDLYDEHQLINNDIPIYSATFVHDLYVNFDLAQETAMKIGKCKTFVTNILYHDGLGRKSDEVVKRLFALRDDVID